MTTCLSLQDTFRSTIDHPKGLDKSRQTRIWRKLTTLGYCKHVRKFYIYAVKFELYRPCSELAGCVEKDQLEEGGSVGRDDDGGHEFCCCARRESETIKIIPKMSTLLLASAKTMS